MLSKTTQYAIRALVYIQMQNTKGRRPGFKEVAKETGAPEHFTAKILQILTRYDMIDSAKGRGGGFYFSQGGDELNIYEVIRAMEARKDKDQSVASGREWVDQYVKYIGYFHKLYQTIEKGPPHGVGE